MHWVYVLHITAVVVWADQTVQTTTAPFMSHSINSKYIMYLYIHMFHYVGPVDQSEQRLTTGQRVRDRIPVGTRFSAHPDRPWGPLSLLHNGYRVFPRGKVRLAHAADHSPPSIAAVMEEQSYTSTHPLGHTRPVTGTFYVLPMFYYI